MIKPVIAFIKKQLNERNYKRLILLLCAFASYLVIVMNNKIDTLANTVKNSDDSIKKEMYNRMDGMYSGAVSIFTDYTANAGRDMQTIIEYCVKSNRDAKLLKDLVSKSTTQITQEVQKQQFKNRYPMDSIKLGPIRVEKVSLLNYLDSTQIFSLNP